VQPRAKQDSEALWAHVGTGLRLEAADNTDTYVVVVLTASPGINVQVGSPGVEIARFDPPTPAMPRPHIQSSSELDNAGINAAPRVRSAPNQIVGSQKCP
jgi:hypothetical protein